MKSLELGQSISILANFGVLVGILLLIFELSQNRQMMQAQTRNELSQSIVTQFFAGAADENLADLVLRGHTGQLQSEVDELRYFWWFVARFRYWENVHYQYRLGLYDENEYTAQFSAFAAGFRRAGMRKFWDQNKSTFSPEFVAAVDGALGQQAAE